MRWHYRHPNHLKTEFIKLNNRKCKACWQCIAACPNDVIGFVDIIIHKHAHIDSPEYCKGCMKCVAACSQNAIVSLNSDTAKGKRAATPRHVCN